MRVEDIERLYPDQLMAMVDDEIEEVRREHERQREHGKRKISYSAARNIAYERVCRWIKEASEEELDPSNISQLARWICYYRRAKVWATIVGNIVGRT